MKNHRHASLPQQTVQPTLSLSFTEGCETEQPFLRLLNERRVEGDLASGEKKQLKQPVARVNTDNIFTWHLNRHTVFEDETDPMLIKQGVRLRRVGVTEGGRLTENQIAVQETRLGIRLPAPWRDVYKHFNGGWVHALRWGDMNNPHINDIEPIPQTSHEYLALEDVAPLRDILPAEREDLDCSSLDPRLIAIAHAGSQAVLLDYRQSDNPRVCLAFFSKYDDHPLVGWETDKFTFWWPNMAVSFAGFTCKTRSYDRQKRSL